MKARFCNQCGGLVETREVEGRPREVCTHCGRVFYRNPLPVAAAVVLDPKRQVLLIKRKNEPRRGLWCLPMGFAELGETIAHAALRELEEEAGIRGRVTRLLDAESAKIDPYGDLLLITFEVERTGGQEKAGDDAEDLAYFPLHELPGLAFAANQRAIRHCVQAHREPWAIQDSFRHLSEPSEGGLLSDALVAMISRHARAISQAWLQEVRTHPTTPSYAKAEPAKLLDYAVRALSQFSAWLLGSQGSREIAHFYQGLGAERRELGFALPEVVSSLSLLRKHMLRYATEHGVWHGALDAYKVVELDHRIILFFDQALYHTARGYAEAAVEA
jgi:8-oxo-dGTP diphosphatase